MLHLDVGPDIRATTWVDGRSVDGDVELTQGDKTAVRAATTLAEPEHNVVPLLSVNPIRSSHSANSGAGRLFRTRRR